MRKTKRIMLIALVIMISAMSCNKEELFIEPVIEEVIDDQVENSEGISNEDTGEVYEVDPSLPCDFKLNDVKPNSTIIINCVLDLEGSTVNLPEGVSFIYEGGDIINGTLNLSGSSIVSGELLNATLTLGGAVPQMKDRIFKFDPQRWGIVEGKVSDKVAKTNGDIINRTISMAKKLGVDTFLIDKMDAYFGLNTDDRKAYAIHVPSDFNLIMTDNTNIRLQPNGLKEYALIFSWETDNVLISGGKLWGDRYTHDYKTITSTHEWGHIIWFKAVHNGVVDNVEMHEGTGDGFYLSSSSDRNADGSLKPDRRESFNITVKNCLINDNRRDNISLVDGKDIVIEYNTIINAGSDKEGPGASSNAIAPGVAVIIESREAMAPDGNSLYTWEKVENVHMRYNVLENNRADLVILSGEKAFIYENTFRSKIAISVSAAVNGKVYNNRFENAESLASNSRALLLESRTFANGEDRVKNYEVINNTFTGYQYGVLANGTGHKIKDNTITNCLRGIALGNSKDLEFDNNKISSNVNKSYGYYTFSGETSIKNCLIKNGETNVKGFELYFSNMNNDETGDIIIDNVDFDGDIALNNVQNTTVKNCTFNNIEIQNCTPTLIDNN